MRYSSDQLRELIAEQERLLREPNTVLFSQSRYEITRVLGEGGMGITCLADEISAANMKRPVVLKFVKDSLDPRRLAQFLNEAQLAILFNHPNLVTVYRLETETLTLDEETGRGRERSHTHTVHYMVMQFIDGWNLRQIVNRFRSLKILTNYDISMFIIGRVARGLHYVHNYRDENGMHLGLIHRDVSPENILIDHFGRIKVADFGITKAAKLSQDDISRHAGKLIYCSPEQLDGKPLDARSDIYNVGLLMYFLFTDLDRFQSELGTPNARDRIRQKMQRSALPELKDVPSKLAQICEICLRETPGERYQNCEDLGTDIDIYFKEARKVVTNEQLEEMLLDLFNDNPEFVSRRFIPLSGTTRLAAGRYDPATAKLKPEEMEKPLPTVRMDASEEPEDD